MQPKREAMFATGRPDVASLVYRFAIDECHYALIKAAKRRSSMPIDSAPTSGEQRYRLMAAQNHIGFFRSKRAPGCDQSQGNEVRGIGAEPRGFMGRTTYRGLGRRWQIGHGSSCSVGRGGWGRFLTCSV